MKTRERMFACLFAPAMPLQSIARSEPDLRERPLVIIDGDGAAARITHISGAARRLGVRIGMTRARARSTAPDVVVRRPADGVLAATQRALLDIAAAFSHTVGDASNGTVLMEATGHLQRYGSLEKMGRAVITAAAADGLVARIGFASGPRLARIASRVGPDIVIFDTGRERAALVDLDIATLEPSQPLIDEMARLRIRTVGQLAALPSNGIGTRLGPEGMRLHALALGIDESVIENPIQPGDSFLECVEMDWPLDNMEPLMFMLSGAADRIIARMDRRGLCPDRVSLTLNLESGGIHVIGTTAAAVNDSPSTISTLLHRALTRTPPPAAVTGFSLVISAGSARAVQCQLFGPPVLEPAKVREITSRLMAIAGEGNVGAPAILDSNRRDPTSIMPFAPAWKNNQRPTRDSGKKPVMAFRRFNPPFDAVIACRDEMPSEISSDLVSGRVCRTAGPWYLDAAWWTDAPQAGALYDIEVPGRGIFRLWHDLIADRWYVDGAWD